MNVYPQLDTEFTCLKDAAAAVLRPLGAFVRTDRGHALFVSDAPRHGAARVPALEAQFNLHTEGRLLFLSPQLPNVPETLRVLYLRLLKADPATRDRMLREALAECMRLHRTQEMQFLEHIFEGGT